MEISVHCRTGSVQSSDVAQKPFQALRNIVSTPEEHKNHRFLEFAWLQMNTTPPLNDFEAHYAARRLLTLETAFGRDQHLEKRLLQTKARERFEGFSGGAGDLVVFRVL